MDFARFTTAIPCRVRFPYPRAGAPVSRRNHVASQVRLKLGWMETHERDTVSPLLPEGQELCTQVRLTDSVGVHPQEHAEPCGSVPYFTHSKRTGTMQTIQTKPMVAMPFVRAYLRASIDDQDAERARADLEAFAANHGLEIASWYVENESGAKLQRPELFRLIGDARKGDLLLVEQVDRLSRLRADDWEILKAEMARKHIRVVALELPTSWMAAHPTKDEVTRGILDAVNHMLLDMLAVVARKDYDDRRRRQAQGIEKARRRAYTVAGRWTQSGMRSSVTCWTEG